MHGRGKNAKGMRDTWARQADQYGWLIVAPLFDAAQWAGNAYSYGSVLTRDGKPREASLWSFNVVEHCSMRSRRPPATRAPITSSTATRKAANSFIGWCCCYRTRVSPERSPPIPAGTRCQRSTPNSPTAWVARQPARRLSRKVSPETLRYYSATAIPIPTILSCVEPRKQWRRAPIASNAVRTT